MFVLAFDFNIVNVYTLHIYQTYRVIYNTILVYKWDSEESRSTCVNLYPFFEFGLVLNAILQQYNIQGAVANFDR